VKAQMAYRYPPVNYPHGPTGDPRRSQQIDELITVFPNTKILGADRSILEYPFHLRDGRALTLQILLPALFPEHPPRLVLDQHLNHPLINTDLSINLPLLRDWKPQIRLVDMLLQAQELIFGAGPISQTAMPHAHRPPPPPPSHSSQGSNSPAEMVANTQHQEAVNHLLQQCSNEELYKILTDPNVYDEFISVAAAKLNVLGPGQKDEENVRLAQENLERDNEIQDRMNQIAIVKSSDYASMCRMYGDEMKQHQALMSRNNIPSLLQQLQDTSQKLQEDSEALLTRALSREVPIQDFIEEYQRMRREYHQKDLLAKSAGRL